MPTHVQAPDGSVIEFPDSMKDADIESAMGKLFPAPRPATSGSMALDFMQGGGAELIGTALGAYNLLRKIPGADKVLPAVSPEVQQYAEPPHTVAAKIGGLFTTLGEFAVPAGEAGALTKGAGLLTRAGAQAAAAGGTQLARTGGDVPSAADAAALGAAGPIAGAALGAAAPIAGRVLKATPGIAADVVGMVNPKLGYAVRAGLKGYRAYQAAAAAAEEAAPAAAPAAEAAAPTVAKTAGQTLAEAEGQNWDKLSGAQQEMYQRLSQTRDIAAENVPQPKPARGSEYYGVKAAEVPPTNPAPSVPAPTAATPPAATPASAAPTAKVQPIRLEPAAPPEQVKTSGRTFVKDTRPSAEDYTLVQVPTAKLDAGWAKEGPAFYIPPGGGGAEIGGRLQGAKDFIQTGQPIEAPRISMAENGRIVFEDGRHRFAAVRDAGDKTTAVMVPHEQVGDFQALSKPTTAADVAKAKFANAKADRIIGAIQDFGKDFNTAHPEQPFTTENIANYNPSQQAKLVQLLKSNGYLKNTEKYPNLSWPYIVTKLRQAEYARKP